jgi:glycosyltransferase involved in cell wall biosynthesis
MIPRVCWHICSNRWNSAVTEYALSAALAMRMRGWNSVFSPLIGSPAETRARALGLPTIPFASFHPGSFAKFKDTSRAIKAEAVIVYGGQEATLLRLDRSLRSTVKVRFFGQSNWQKRQWFHRAINHLTGPFPDIVIAPGPSLSRSMSAAMGRSVESVPLGVNTDRFHFNPDAQPKGGVSELLVLGRFDPVKGHSFFFQCVARVFATLEPGKFRLHVAGRPANIPTEEIRLAAQKAGLVEGQNFCITAGDIGDVAALMNSAVGGAVPSLGSELICRVAEEFLLCGTPIIVSGVGSLGDILFPGAGVAYADNNPQQITDKLRSFILGASREAARDRQERARVASRHYSLVTMGERLDQLIGCRNL